MWPKLLEASLETLAMSFFSSLIALFFGLILGLFLAANHKERSSSFRFYQKLASTIVNLGRALPFIILLIAIMPLTRLLVGSTIGWIAAILPLSIGAIPLYARLAETALREVPKGLYEAGLAMGATPLQIYLKIYLPEARPSLVRAATTLLVSLIGFSTMAGIIGGGGLGALAYHYGFQRFDSQIMLATVVLLVILVQGLQLLGDALARILEHKA
jgi:D-methionine transport system permease protein